MNRAMARCPYQSLSRSALGFHLFSGNRITGFIWWALKTQIFVTFITDMTHSPSSPAFLIDLRFIVIQQSRENLKNLGVIYFGMSCVTYPTVSPTGVAYNLYRLSDTRQNLNRSQSCDLLTEARNLENSGLLIC